MKNRVAERRTSVLIICLVCIVLLVPVTAEAGNRQNPRLVDDAGLLDESQEAEVLEKLDEISNRQMFDVVIVTVDSTEGKTPMAFADDYYDYNGYGVGENHDGILLLISMEERDWYISTTGFGITAFTDAGLEYMEGQFVEFLSDGEYQKAFETFAKLCDEFVTKAKEGEVYREGNLPRGPFPFLWIPIGLVLGGVVAFFPVQMMKREMNNVQRRTEAGDYIKRNGIAITDQRDMFLYRTVNRTARPKDTSSGSSTHRSSSGTTHGGCGGKF